MEKNNFEITLMTKEDLEIIKNNISDFDDFWNYETLKEEFQSDTSIYIIGKLNDEIVSFSGIKLILDEAELMNIVVKKNYRGQGYSLLMINFIINLCKEKKISKINLEVNSNNSIAINLYKKYNFTIVGLRKKYYNNIDDAILMTLNL